MQDKNWITDTDERIFTLRDCVDLFVKNKKKIFQFAFLCGSLVFCMLLFKTTHYKVDATFKEGGEKEGSGGLKELLGNIGPNRTESQMAILMKSHPVLKPLISKLGLQARVCDRGLLVKVYRRIKNNFLANGLKPLEDQDPFVFRDVSYEGLEEISLRLFFEDRENFSLLLPSGQSAARGKIGAPVEIGQDVGLAAPIRFTLAKIPKSLRVRRQYPLKMAPWVSLVQDLSNRLSITPNKLNKSIFLLSFIASDRHQAAQTLAVWMETYLDYLKKDHDEMDKQQLEYLEKRQQQMYAHLSAAYEEYGNYLSENLKSNGSLGLEQEIRRTLEPLHSMSERILSIDLELARLDQADTEQFSSLLDDPILSVKFKELQELQQHRDLLLVSIDERHASLIAKNRLEGLKDIREQKGELKELLSQVKERKMIPAHFDFEPEQALVNWAASLSQTNEQERNDFSAYLENYIRILGVKEKIEQTRFFQPLERRDELEGIDLATAKTLFVEYNHKLDESESASRYYQTLKDDLERTDFEFGSLGSALTDEVSQKLIMDANRTLMLFKDENHRSAKEKERWQEELDLQKKILGEHLEQLLKIEELNRSFMQDRIVALRHITLDCVNQNISVIYEGIRDFINEKKKALLNEKRVLEEKMKEQKLSLSSLPESWRKEKMLDLKAEFSTKLMEAVTELVETKTIGHHLYRIDSKPLNYPILPSLAVVPRLYMKSFTAAAAGGAAFFFILLVSTIFKGFPSSFEKMKAMKLPVLGELSSFCDGENFESLIGPDLELIRQISLFLKRSPQCQVIGLIAGKGPDYSYALAENLAKMSRKSLILRCDFDSPFRVESMPGLLQFLEKETTNLPLRQGKGFDYVVSGGYTPFCHEKIHSQPFKELLESVKNEYDCIFLLFRSPLTAPESKGILDFCDRAIITVCGEPTEMLTPFSHWGYDDGHQRVMFINSRRL